MNEKILTMTHTKPSLFSFLILLCVILTESSASAGSCKVSHSENRIVFIGDSISAGEFGATVAKELSAQTGLEVQRFAVAGSASIHWNSASNSFLRKLTTSAYCDGMGTISRLAPPPDYPVANDLMKVAPSPKAVVIALGTNDANWNCLETNKIKQVEQIKKLISQLPSKTPCIWVGPPNSEKGDIFKKCGSKNYGDFVAHLKEAASDRCNYVDSRDIKVTSNYSASPASFTVCQEASDKPLTPDSGDGIHPGAKQAAYWAHCVVSAITETLQPSAHPLDPGAQQTHSPVSGVVK